MMLAPPATVRVDLDGDVDQEDFGYFQACLSGPDVQLVPGCEGADLDSDGDAHQDDFGVCQACMSGANIPADPNCANWICPCGPGPPRSCSWLSAWRRCDGNGRVDNGHVYCCLYLNSL